MASKKKLLQAAAGSAGGAGLDVDEVFSTFLYTGTGTGSNLTVTNNIDLSTEGGLVWVKNRDATAAHALFDTVRGQNVLESQSDGGQDAFSAYGGSASASYNTNGFGINGTGASNLNQSGVDYASWTFRKAPKFFDVVTWTGNGTTGRSISHSLDSPVGMIIAKKTSGGGQWSVLHRSVTISGSPAGGLGRLNLTNAFTGYSSGFNEEFPSSTAFKVSHVSGASSQTLNTSGENYVAYIFAHNNSDGEFGPDGDADIIKCGSYTGNAGNPQLIELGFEPQFLMVKCTTNSGDWFVVDNMRGVLPNADYGDSNRTIYWNKSDAEIASGNFGFYSTGFAAAQSSSTNGSGRNFIYMAIRRGPLAAPTDATKVFALDYANGSDIPAFQSGFPIDMGLLKQTTGTGTFRISSRLTQGEYLETSETNAASANTNYVYDYQNGFFAFAYSSAYVGWMWKRAPEYFDVVAYSGTGSNRTVSHNLGVVPEMMWVKRRNSNDNWVVYHSAIGPTKILQLNNTIAATTTSTRFNDTAPTSSVFTVGTDGEVNGGGTTTYIAYLFATVAGVSKVGSYTGNGTSQNIDCGFSSGARFVLIKSIAAGTNWIMFDSVRGIVSGNDPYLLLNTNAAEVTNTDYIDPYSGGFAVTGVENDINASGDTFIFYAVA